MGQSGGTTGGRARTLSPARGGGPVLTVVLSETKGAQGTSLAPGVLSPIISSALRRLRRTLMMDFIILPERETSLRFPSPCPLPCPPRGDPVPTSSPAPPAGFCSFVGFPQTWCLTQTPVPVIWDAQGSLRAASLPSSHPGGIFGAKLSRIGTAWWQCLHGAVGIGRAARSCQSCSSSSKSSQRKFPAAC